MDLVLRGGSGCGSRGSDYCALPHDEIGAILQDQLGVLLLPGASWCGPKRTNLELGRLAPSVNKGAKGDGLRRRA